MTPVLGGCDDDSDHRGVAATDRAFAAVAAGYVGIPEYATGLDYGWAVQFKGDLVAADLRYQVGNPNKDPNRGGNLYPGDAVQVLAGTEFDGPDFTSCDGLEDSYHCEELEGGATATWTLEDPEEDPGHIMVAVPKGDVTVLVIFAGPHITRDPRTMDLPVTIEDLDELAQDERINLTTTQAAADAGGALEYWLDTAPAPGRGRGTQVPLRNVG